VVYLKVKHEILSTNILINYLNNYYISFIAEYILVRQASISILPLFQLLCLLFQLGLGAADKNDVQALFGKQLSVSFANAVGAAGDDCPRAVLFEVDVAGTEKEGGKVVEQAPRELQHCH